MIEILIADDHAVLRHGVRQVIDGQPDMRVALEVSTAQALLDALSVAPPSEATRRRQLLVLDLSLPDMSGMDLLRAVRAAAPQLRVVILTMYPEDQLALHMLDAGAAAYLSKSRPPSELLAAIRTVAAGRRYLTDTLSSMDSASAPTRASELPHERLSAREYQVFILLVQGKAPSEVAGLLGVASSTVSTHIANLKVKLAASTVQDIILYAHRVGLLG